MKIQTTELSSEVCLCSFFFPVQENIAETCQAVSFWCKDKYVLITDGLVFPTATKTAFLFILVCLL